MALTDAQWKTALLSELGEPDNTTLAAQVDFYWELYADKAAVYRLRYLYAKLDALQWLLGRMKNVTDVRSGTVEEKSSQRFQHLLDLRTATEADIARTERQAGAVGGSAVGQLVNTAPTRPCHPPDPNAPVYKGDPLRRRRYR